MSAISSDTQPEGGALGGVVGEALAALLARIREHEARHGRTPGSVTLLAVSKKKPTDAIKAAIAAGQRRFGENYLDEASKKMALIGRRAPDGTPLEWHYIGAIQSRKCADIADRFDWVHGVDRLKVANRLSARIEQTGAVPLNVCLQVNVDGESSKAGVAPEALGALADDVAVLPGLVLRGVMAIPAPREEFDEQRAVLRELESMRAALAERHASIDTLSCGMSGDLEAAIAEGATIVRIGTALFGMRD